MRGRCATIGGLIGFLFGGGFHGFVHGEGLGLVLGIVIGYLTGWLMDLHPQGSNRDLGSSLGWIYGMLIGALGAHFAHGGFLHFWVAVLLFGKMGSLFGGQVIAGLADLSNYLEGDHH